jgi:hypothetical protein
MDLEVYLPSIGVNLQREYVWNYIQERELIMSILLGRTIPPIKFICKTDLKTLNEQFEIIDGKQRITAILRFLDDKFKITIEDTDYYYSQLGDDFKREILQYVLLGQPLYESSVDNVVVPITDQEKVTWFNQINFAGTPQELSHRNKINRVYE